ncbi:MAG: serine/threonine-protein kinase [Planctomycetaceae bacterium]
MHTCGGQLVIGIDMRFNGRALVMPEMSVNNPLSPPPADNTRSLMDEVQATVVFDSSPAKPVPVPDSDSMSAVAEMSRGQVGFVAGQSPKFSDETAALLRSRLYTFALVVFFTLGASILSGWFKGVTTLWGLRVAVLVMIAAVASLLRKYDRLSVRDLRIGEAFVFLGTCVQLAAMFAIKIDLFAERGDAVSIAALRHEQFGAWCILIFAYGTLIPNHWKRAAAILLPASIVPYLLVAGVIWINPASVELIRQDRSISTLPLPLVAAIIAIFGSHTINTVRREAFKARQFGQYKLQEKLGAGGMGEVYKAEHTLLKRPCAIKLIKTDQETDSAAVARFEKEVQATARLTHWNTVEIFDYGRTDDGTFYYVMELLPGMALDEVVKNYGPLPPSRVVHLLRQVCGALSEAHAMELIHRDIKPANIFLSQRGGVYDVAKLLDFGLVKEKQDQAQPGVKYGSFSGTPLYMSPEQAAAYDDVDGRADIYSLGAVAYYLLTGETPFASKNVMELLAAHQNAEVVPPSQRNAAIPADLDTILLKCMAKHPADRFQSTFELQQALTTCSVADLWTNQDADTWWHRISLDHRSAERPATDQDVTLRVSQNSGNC